MNKHLISSNLNSNFKSFKCFFPLLIGIVFFLFFISCGGGSDPWAIPTEYQNLTLNQLKDKSIINNTYEGLILAKSEKEAMTTVAKEKELKADESKLNQLAYFEGEIDPSTFQRKDDPTVFDVWICYGETIQRGDTNNTCDDFIFLKYKDDRGPKVEPGDKIRFAGIFEGVKTKRLLTGEHRSMNTLKTYPQFRAILLEIIK